MGIAIEEIENEIINLPQDQLRKFRAWYEVFDSNAWDEQIEQDVVTGKLDGLASAAIADHKAGKSTKL
ncbi:MAG: hypothetical protein Q9M14_02305 [Mariprofundaceae bacterium]|nr:hypothetical protein [Mariprofundaceae bacterium]